MREDSHGSSDLMMGFELVRIVMGADYGGGGFEEWDCGVTVEWVTNQATGVVFGGVVPGELDGGSVGGVAV